jgi:hypothetical protein
MSTPEPQDLDRRQNPRIRCGGLANIVSLPSEGLSVSGKVLNLSLGGCGIATAVPLPIGTRAEIMLCVNAVSFRVLGQVQALPAAHLVCVEFLLLSALGRHMVADLIQELAKQRAIANLLKGSRRQPDYEAAHRTRQALVHGKHPFGERFMSLREDEAKVSADPSLGAINPGSGNCSVILSGDELDVYI